MKKQSPQILTTGELQSLKDEKHELESTLKSLEGGDRVGAGTAAEQIDRGKLRAEAQRLGKLIESGTPGKISGQTKDRLFEEARQLGEQIQNGMCSQDEMRRPEKHPGSIQKHVEWERRNQANIQRWKQIQRQLEHSDPTAASIERLRRA